jgi:hypothetical protein
MLGRMDSRKVRAVPRPVIAHAIIVETRDLVESGWQSAAES